MKTRAKGFTVYMVCVIQTVEYSYTTKVGVVYTMVDHLITYISTSLFHITGVVTIIRKYKVLGIKLVK